MNDRLGIPPISKEAAATGVYMGSTYSYTPGRGAKTPGGKGTSAGATVSAQDVFVPTEEAWGGYGNLSPEVQRQMVQIMNAKAGSRPWNPEELKGLWSDGILMSNYIVRQTGERVSPVEALRRYYLGDGDGAAAARAAGTGGGGGGGGGGYSGPVTQTRLTDPKTAENLLDNSLKSYLGRAATKKERSAFLNALREYEMENPTVTTPVGQAGSITTGGASPTAFAEEFAAAQEGAAEYGAATTYFDSFLDAIKNPVG